MQLKWTSKALSDITRLYEFLAAVNQPAAAHTIQQLTAAPTTLLTNPRIGERAHGPRRFCSLLGETYGQRVRLTVQ